MSTPGDRAVDREIVPRARDNDREARFDRIWRSFAGDPLGFDEHAYEGKRTVITPRANQLRARSTTGLAVGAVDG